MAEMATESVKVSGLSGMGVNIPKRPSYVDNHPQSGEGPGSMPELLREVTLLRGTASGLDQKVTDLLNRLDPIRRRMPTPSGEDVEKAKANLSTFPEPVSDLANDLRQLSDRLGALMEHVDRVHVELGL